MWNIVRNKNFYLMLLFDGILVTASYFLGYFIRFEGEIPHQGLANFKATILYILSLKLILFIFCGLYGGVWRYTSLVDLFNVLKATTLSSGIIVLAILFIYRFEGFPRSVFIIDGFLTFIFIGGLRVGIRVFLSEQDRGFQSFRDTLRIPIGKKLIRPKKRLLIIGGGDAGEKIIREIKDNPRLHYEVVGVLDDDPKKKGMRIHGVPVLGSLKRIHDMAYHDEMDEILIAFPSASAKQMRKIIQACEATGFKTRTTPGIGELIDGKISFKTIREVSFEDLLGRDPIDLDMKRIGDYLTDKVILVTGAGGSIGSELCRQVVSFKPKSLILLDKTENNLFHIEMEFCHRFPETPIHPVLGDVHNKGFLGKLFAMVQPQVVFHAAAFKHVPIVELNPWEGIFNNIIGTQNMIEASHQSGVERFVMISTDKAVRPVNVMGATKRVAEMITSCYADHPNNSFRGGKFVSVRFGNVIGSEGSVVHLFKKQIERFGPVTVTHPEITRYFMTIPEACKLILQAGALGEGAKYLFLIWGLLLKLWIWQGTS